MPRKRKQLPPSRKSLTQAAQKCVFDPRKPGPMKIIADINNIDYYQNRAIEAIVNANSSKEISVTIDQLRQAVGLLLLTLVKIENEQNQEKQPEGS